MNGLRGAMIGTGYSAGAQLRAWAEVEGTEIVAITGRDRSRAAARAAEFGIGAVHDNTRALLASESLDFVDIAVPPAAHEEIVLAAAAHGVNVFCQKPAAEDLASMRRMIDASERAGIVFAINENCRFQPWFRSIRRHLADGRIGEPISATFSARARLSLPVARFEKQPQLGQMPRLIVFELGIHFLDTARYFFGPATTVYGQTRRVSSHISGEDVAVVISRHGKTIVTLDLSWASAPSTRATGVSWADVRVDGTGGSIFLGTDGSLRIIDDDTESCEQFGSDAIHVGYRDAQAHFASCLRSGITPETAATDQLETLELVFGAYESSRTGDVYKLGRDVRRLA